MLPRMVPRGAAAIDLAELAGVPGVVDCAAEGAFGHWGACGGVSGRRLLGGGAYGRCFLDRRRGRRRRRGPRCRPCRRRHKGNGGGLGRS